MAKRMGLRAEQIHIDIGRDQRRRRQTIQQGAVSTQRDLAQRLHNQQPAHRMPHQRHAQPVLAQQAPQQSRQRIAGDQHAVAVIGIFERVRR